MRSWKKRCFCSFYMPHDKFVVRVGRDFEENGALTVTVIRSIDPPSISWKKVLAIAFAVAIFGSVLASAMYAYLTGDYSPLLDLVKAGSELVSAAAKAVSNGK